MNLVERYTTYYASAGFFFLKPIKENISSQSWLRNYTDEIFIVHSPNEQGICAFPHKRKEFNDDEEETYSIPMITTREYIDYEDGTCVKPAGILLEKKCCHKRPINWDSHVENLTAKCLRDISSKGG